MPTVHESLEGGVRKLAAHSESPRLDAQVLLGAVLGLSRSGLITHGGAPVPHDRLQAYDTLLDRRMAGAPVAYLTGSREFWSLDLIVTADVLVPRPETELAVELALERLPRDNACSVLDLGTGSGAIALALSAERPLARIVAVDVSAAALEVARENARRLGHPRIEWRCGSWFEAVPGRRFDLIVANPPYIAALDPALKFLSAEPLLALSPGETGLEALALIIGGAKEHLSPSGWILLEHASSQGPAVASLLERQGFGTIHTYADAAGKPRVCAAFLPAAGPQTDRRHPIQPSL